MNDPLSDDLFETDGGPARGLETQLLLFPEALPVEPDGLREILARKIGAPVYLTLTRNRTSVLTFKKRADGSYDIRLQRLFLEAPDDVLDAIVSFVRRPTRAARERVAGFFNARPAAERRPARPHAQPPTPRTRGSSYDLDEILARLNERYFGGLLATRITWGAGRTAGAAARDSADLDFEGMCEAPAGAEGCEGGGHAKGGAGRSRRGATIRFGSYLAEHDLIRIHPALDAPWVPRYFVESIVYHEMLHAVIPIARDDRGRRCIHPPEFRRREREFHAFDEAIDWERRNLSRLLGERG